MSKQPLKSGEKILFVIFGLFMLFAVIGYIILETVRLRSDTPLFEQTTHFDFSELGRKGHNIYMKANCNACHRALRSGTSMGLSLDGIGSKRSEEWLEQFLIYPEKMYGAQTLDHGFPPKEAAYVTLMPKEDLKAMAVFLSELRADPGSSVAKVPPPERSEFIETMLKTWAPPEWKDKYEDVRDRVKREAAEQEQEQGQ